MAEVVNLSVSGHGNAEELIMLQEEGFNHTIEMHRGSDESE